LNQEINQKRKQANVYMQMEIGRTIQMDMYKREQEVRKTDAVIDEITAIILSAELEFADITAIVEPELDASILFIEAFKRGYKSN
jgi:hypothetical protein